LTLDGGFSLNIHLYASINHLLDVPLGFVPSKRHAKVIVNRTCYLKFESVGTSVGPNTLFASKPCVTTRSAQLHVHTYMFCPSAISSLYEILEESQL
jgi:hypothetical protein